MTELKFEIPTLLKDEAGKIKEEIKELIQLEEKRKLLSLLIDEMMKGARQLNQKDLTNLGRTVTRGRSTGGT